MDPTQKRQLGDPEASSLQRVLPWKVGHLSRWPHVRVSLISSREGQN
jgi:hypothetical protein